MSATVTAAGVLQLLTLIQAAANAAPILAKLKGMAEQGASFEQLLEAARQGTVTSEADAQAQINK